MLTQLLRADNIAYTIKPVSNFSQVVQNYRNYVTPEIKTVIMINCGAVRSCIKYVLKRQFVANFFMQLFISFKMHNIPRLFGLDRGGDTRCFIFDNHRPFHLANIHSRYNVVVFDDDIEIARDITEGFIPSDASDLSAASDNDSSDEDEDEDDDDQEEQEEVRELNYCSLAPVGCQN
jgi:CDC45-like protein